jgi:hypothetical protein
VVTEAVEVAGGLAERRPNASVPLTTSETVAGRVARGTVRSGNIAVIVVWPASQLTSGSGSLSTFQS